ncbi:MAG TPA: ATP-dependent sacrificial sulfur transferase LarE, partial [Armatimonadota bacterium]|nr:ATP-dependent sacrificial sulfur transferase LarE [Armatimonadota bacterium]
EEGLDWVAHGANVDDLGDYRPGGKAAKELGIRAPLQEADFTKAEIRELSRELGLATWNKPSLACLASRMPYGTPITPDALRKVDEAEKLLKSLGFRQLRVRHHGDIARIEVETEEIPRLLDCREEIVRRFKELGYLYVTVDIEGYRTGSMNEAINVQRSTLNVQLSTDE